MMTSPGALLTLVLLLPSLVVMDNAATASAMATRTLKGGGMMSGGKKGQMAQCTCETEPDWQAALEYGNTCGMISQDHSLLSVLDCFQGAALPDYFAEVYAGPVAGEYFCNFGSKSDQNNPVRIGLAEYHVCYNQLHTRIINDRLTCVQMPQLSCSGNYYRPTE